jgi:hypothetical protein
MDSSPDQGTWLFTQPEGKLLNRGHQLALVCSRPSISYRLLDDGLMLDHAGLLSMLLQCMHSW